MFSCCALFARNESNTVATINIHLKSNHNSLSCRKPHQIFFLVAASVIPSGSTISGLHCRILRPIKCGVVGPPQLHDQFSSLIVVQSETVSGALSTTERWKISFQKRAQLFLKHVFQPPSGKCLSITKNCHWWDKVP